MKHLRQLEDQSVYILREAYKHFEHLAMLWSMGKDSTVLLWLTRKAFFGHVPFPLVHIDTGYEMPELIEYRDRICREWRLRLVVGQNQAALDQGMSHTVGRVACCTALKVEAMNQVIAEQGYSAIILGIRSDEEGTRAKERYFSPRNKQGEWDFREQPPELWHQYKTSFPDGEHIRIHPLFDWTEMNIWEYLQLEDVPLPDMYFNKGDGTRFRSLGCVPCTKSVNSPTSRVDEVLIELQNTKIAERVGRAQDEGHGMEQQRKLGHM
ncbi:MAG: sulfate adenylyltransferase subunit CysD [Nitrospirales bacterium]|nr:sulfate adenylyltransferase subunit CysD [Nitrospirales bacterium]